MYRNRRPYTAPPSKDEIRSEAIEPMAKEDKLTRGLERRGKCTDQAVSRRSNQLEMKVEVRLSSV